MYCAASLRMLICHVEDLTAGEEEGEEGILMRGTAAQAELHSSMLEYD